MHYDLQEHLMPRITGQVRWESVEPMDLLQAVNHITMGGVWMTYGGWFKPPGMADHGAGKWARYFPSTGQGGGYTGEAVVFVYGSGGYWQRNNPEEWVGTKPTAFRVAICKHEKVGSGSADDARRGWHPGACRLCGLDMTVDSGD